MSVVQLRIDRVGGRKTARPTERGQALVELLVFALLGVLMFFATFQLYLVGWTMQRSIAAAHAVLFAKAFTSNCPNRTAPGTCTYDIGARGMAIWSPRILPEVRIPTLPVFERHGILPDARLWSNAPVDRPAGCRSIPECWRECRTRLCKQTRIGAGTWSSLDEVFDVANVDVPPLARPFLSGK